MNRTFWNSASLCGLLLALITIAVFLLNTFFPNLPSFLKTVINLAKTVGTIYLLYSYMKDYASTQAYHSYGAAFRFGFVASLCSAVMVGAYQFLHFQFLFPEQIDAYMKLIENAAAANPQITPAHIRTIARVFPTLMPLAQVFSLTLMGVIISAILANVTKSKTPFQTPGIQ